MKKLEMKSKNKMDEKFGNVVVLFLNYDILGSENKEPSQVRTGLKISMKTIAYNSIPIKR